MFRLRATFALRSAHDVCLLTRVYDDVQGEAAFYVADAVRPLLVLEWQPQVMKALRRALIGQQVSLDGARVECRLNAPDTVRCVAAQPSRLTLSAVQRERQALLSWWAAYIDRALEATEADDEPVQQQLVLAEHAVSDLELYQALRLSQKAQFCVPHANGFLVMSAASRSLVDLDWNGTTAVGHDIAYHLYHGFMHCCSGALARRQLNAPHVVWRAKGYEGELSDLMGLAGLGSSTPSRPRPLEQVLTTPLPEKRGRPRKNPLPVTPALPAPPTPLVVTGPKKRGRPRKNPLPAQ